MDSIKRSGPLSLTSEHHGRRLAILLMCVFLDCAALFLENATSFFCVSSLAKKEKKNEGS